MKGSQKCDKCRTPKEHYNLYYLFEEDKRRNALDQKTAADIWKKVCAAVINKPNGLSPPPPD